MAPSAPQDLRRLILDATRHLLVRDGYAGLSMRRIARAIGYSPTTIYLHFESKDALFHALIDEGMGRLYGLLREAAATGGEDPVARLEAICRRYVAFGLEQPEYYEIMFMLHPARTFRYPADKYRQARRNLDLIEAALVDGADTGAYTVEDAHVAAHAVWASLHGTVALLIARRVDVQVDRGALVEAAIRQTLRSYRPEAVRHFA